MKIIWTLVSILIMQITHAVELIRCEVLDMGDTTKAPKHLILSSKEGKEFQANLRTRVQVAGQIFERSQSLSQGDHFTPQINSADEIKLKFIKRVNGKNIQRFVRVDKINKRGLFQDQENHYQLGQCELD